MATRSTPDVLQRIVSSYDPKGSVAAKAASKQFEKDQLSAAATAKTAHGNILSSFLNMAQGANTHLGSVTRAGGQAVGALQNIEKSGAGVASSLAIGVGLGAVAAGAALTAFAIKGVSDFVHLADETHSLELRMGGTAEQASRLIEAGAALGVNSDTLTGAFFKLSKAIEGGEKNFAKYGIVVAQTKNGGTDLHGTLLNIIDAFNATSDPVVQNQIAFTAFGKSGSALIPILAQGRAGLTALEAAAKNVISEDDIARARNYEFAQKRLEEANTHLAASIGQKVLPAFANLSAFAATAASGMDDTEKAYLKTSAGADTLAKAAGGANVPIIGGILAAGNFGDALNKAHDAEVKQTIASQDAKAATDLQTQAMTDAANAADKMYNAFMSGADADWALVKANEAASKSIDDTNKAQDALTKLQQSGSATADQLASATDAVKSAQDNEASSAIAAAKAADAAAKAKAEQTNAVYGARDSINTEIASLQASEANLSGPALTAVQNYVATLQSIPAEIGTTVSVNTTQALANLRALAAAGSSALMSVNSMTPTPHAGGGPVVPGRVYTVGEKGPEQVTFGQSGYVHPNGQGPAPGPGGSNGGGGDINIEYHGAAAPQDVVGLGRELAWVMKTG